MSYIKNISYQGTSILYSDLSNLDHRNAKSAMQSTVNVVSKMPLRSVFSLVNFEGLDLTREILAEIRSIGTRNTPYVQATAVCGLNPMATFIAKTIIRVTRRNAKLFNSPEEGKVWLDEERQRLGIGDLVIN